MKISRDPIIFDFDNKTIVDYPKTNPFKTEISLGTPPQKLNMNINLLSYTYYVASKKFDDKPNIVPFNPKNSTSIYYDESKTDFLDAELDMGDYIYDVFNFGEIHFKEFPFVLAIKLSYRSRLFSNSGLIGFAPDKLSSSQYNTPNFLEELKSHKILVDKKFFIEFEDDNKANIIMGMSAFRYNASKYGNCSAKSKAITDLGVLNWGIALDEIYYGNKNLTDGVYFKIILDLDQVFISTCQFPFNQTLYEDFFKPLIEKKLCEIVSIPKDHQYYICDEHIDLKGFKDLSFYNKEISFNFTFSAQDLFFKVKNKLVFAIRFNDYEIEMRSWIFGSVFLRKYNLEFDIDSKTIGFYFSKPHITPNAPSGLKKRTIIILSVLLILTLSALFTVSWCLYKNKKNTRKKRATEISDDYEYTEINNKNEPLSHK